ncbi:hypothetical protein [Chryseobacterium koreense]|uniref:Uncharacterized protein n=1 Tax=Chryseobacterium koreense CCUG 49689 TaxID=1304281 RepID=A0A0J7IWX7_9FLAO|nr:hypothetical protein [Chryseobacterium koreense]KMQ70314.1 hypothetical protein ACM44_12915 [Chryseobacterium koreense CCUG 49689]MBB5334482.1 nitrogenase subunit NifH [Chryseobacterium koreense]
MSKDIFKDTPDLQEYFETSDGQRFYKEDLAKNHARSLEDKSVATVYRDQEIEATKETAKEIIAKIPEMDLQTAKEYLEAENSDDPRKSVVKALIKRIAELETPKD